MVPCTVPAIKILPAWQVTSSSTRRIPGHLGLKLCATFLSLTICISLLLSTDREWRLHQTSKSNFSLLWPWPLTCNLLMPMSTIHAQFVPICIVIGSLVFKLYRSQVGNRRTNEAMDSQTRRTNYRQVEHIVPLASLDWPTHKSAYRRSRITGMKLDFCKFFTRAFFLIHTLKTQRFTAAVWKGLTSSEVHYSVETF